ncbi:unnamed protein product [Ilex paraguariensis]|uniref:Uncharacterized protein n=1 Tax=Ilex paraguariensis TaxID=185542 RepID=A0ABC8T006_9AQUA
MMKFLAPSLDLLSQSVRHVPMKVVVISMMVIMTLKMKPDYEDNENEDGDGDQISDENDGDNQVVPLSSTPLAPPLVSSSSSI